MERRLPLEECNTEAMEAIAMMAQSVIGHRLAKADANRMFARNGNHKETGEFLRGQPVSRWARQAGFEMSSP